MTYSTRYTANKPLVHTTCTHGPIQALAGKAPLCLIPASKERLSFKLSLVI